jgi:prepilin-type processing-associated H-X9-DG protein
MRSGFSRVELVVTLGVVALGVGILLPAVQAARAKSAQEVCTNNLRKIGIACMEFEETNGGLPPRRSSLNNGQPYGGWGAYILPYLGEDSVAKKYDLKRDFYDPANKEAVETKLAVFVCPSSPTGRTIGIQSQATVKSTNPDKDTVFTVHAAPCDYISSNGMNAGNTGYGINANGVVANDVVGGNQRQAMTDGIFLPLTKITDGTSCTLLLIEQAGRPQLWRNGKRIDSNAAGNMNPTARGAWAGYGSIAFSIANSEGERPAKGDATDCVVNCTNQNSVYGFHTGGANILMSDGAVRFIGTKLDPLTFVYLTIRDDGHLISPTDY